MSKSEKQTRKPQAASRNSTVVYAVVCLLAFIAPFVFSSSRNEAKDVNANLAGWQKTFEGRELRQLDLTVREKRFGEDFPGKVARFTDGQREIIIRYVTEPTRMLHPASDCFKGVGYSITPLPLRVDESGNKWGAFRAARGADNLKVYERIYDERGQSWTDVSAWYWAAVTGRTNGAWWAVTVAESSSD